MCKHHDTVNRNVNTSKRKAVTLLEMMVVISIIVFLVALLIPGINDARERARRVVCANNLRQWGVALQYYRDENYNYIPIEGTVGGPYGNSYSINHPSAWFNLLPPYLNAPRYKDVEGVGKNIKEFPSLDIWICPTKNLMKFYKSGSGKNQFHYAMNAVLDGMGDGPDGSTDTPGYPDPRPAKVTSSQRFMDKPNTVFMIEIAWNSPSGSPRAVATKYQRGFRGESLGRYHGDYANILYLNGGVANCKTDDLVTDHDFKKGEIIWNHPRFYWGYPLRN